MRKTVKAAAAATLAAVAACAAPSQNPMSLSSPGVSTNQQIPAPSTNGRLVVRTAGVASTPPGYGPRDLQSAYSLPSSNHGAGQVVAVVDAYDNPNVASDLAFYRSTFGLPAASLHKYNQRGQQNNYPPGDTSWGLDSDLAVQMVSASCPNCTIDLIEATSSSVADLERAESEAVALGVHIVTNGWSGTGFDQSYFDVAGVTYLAPGGDDGYGSVEQPAAFESVVAVGGTTLTRGGGTRGWHESALPGGGCTTQPKPPWQHDTACANRLANDVSADAGVSPGIAEYDSYGYPGWLAIGGTSVPTPFLAGVFGLAGNAAQQNGGRTFWRASHHQYLYRVKSGKKFVRYATGAGWGTPDGIGAF